MSNRPASEIQHQNSLSAHLWRTWPVVILGTFSFCAGIALTVWNEAHAVSVTKALDEAIQTATVVTDISVLDKSLEGRLLFLTGVISLQEPLTEVDYGVSVMAVKLKRRVQMYQWVEERFESIDGEGNVVSDDYYYYKEWKDKLVDSNLFHTTMSHWNPREFPIKSQVQINEKVFVGVYQLGDEIKKKFNDFVEVASDERPERKDIKLHAGLYYHSVDVWNPEIGDIRIQISYAGQHGDVVTIVAKLGTGGFLIPFTSASNIPILILRSGSYTIEDTFALANGVNKLQTWLYRGGSWVLMYLGCVCLSSLTRLLLFRSRLLRQFAAGGHASLKMTISMSASLLTTSFAWMWYRPYLGASLIGVTAIFLLCTRIMNQPVAATGYRRL